MTGLIIFFQTITAQLDILIGAISKPTTVTDREPNAVNPVALQ